MEFTETQRILLHLKTKFRSPLSDAEIVGEEITRFLASNHHERMREAEQYYLNRSAVQNKTNEIAKRSNTKIEHSILKKLIDQKVNYTFSRPFSISSDNEKYNKALNKLFDDTVRQKVKRFGRGAPKLGVGWMLPYFDGTGKMSFRVIPAANLIPFWEDPEHMELSGFLYFYTIVEYEGWASRTIIKAELWDSSGVSYYSGYGGKFTEDPDKPGKYPHFIFDEQPYYWKTPPLAWCKYNDEELPLQYFLKELIDDLNWQTSTTSDVLRDVAKFIWILKNYGGEDLAEFTDNLRKYLAMKVEEDGGVDTVQPDIQVDAVLNFIDKQRRDIVDLGAGVDTKDPELGSASGKAIYFRYMDLDTDSTNLQVEMKAAFLRLKPFIDDYFVMTGQGIFHDAEFEIVFNTDMPVDETEIFTNAQAAKNIGLSMYTTLSNLPWVKDPSEELGRIKAERAETFKEQEDELKSMAAYDFPHQGEEVKEPPPDEGDSS
ncbi:MAG: phage portal protein [Oscillospiraceae bacterium]